MAYHYARFSNNTNVAVQEGNYAVGSAKQVGIEPGSYLACDYEQGSGNETGGNREDNTTAILAFLNTIVSAGYKPLLYSGAALMKNKINTARILTKYPNCLWVAAYPYKGATNTADFNYFPSMEGVTIWQFTDNWRGMYVDGNINLLELETNGSVSQPTKVPVESTSWIDNFGLRVAKDKECCTILDNVGLYRLFGLPTAEWNWEAMFRGMETGKGEIDAARDLSLRNIDIMDNAPTTQSLRHPLTRAFHIAPMIKTARRFTAKKP